jgi:hypothetical protein
LLEPPAVYEEAIKKFIYIYMKAAGALETLLIPYD